MIICAVEGNSCNCSSRGSNAHELKKGVLVELELATQPAQLKVPVKEQQTTGQQPAEPQQTESPKGHRDQPAEKELLEEKVAEPQQQQAQQAQVQPTYAQRAAHQQPGQQGQLGAQLQGQQAQPHKEQKEQQQPAGEAQTQQPQQAQLQYVRQERVVAPAHRVIKVGTTAHTQGAGRKRRRGQWPQSSSSSLIAEC